jgi:nucleotide-binding universal stress UspA family protein
MYRKILVAYNGSPESQSALHACIHLNPGKLAEIHLLVVMPPPTYVVMGEYVSEAVLNADREELEQELVRGHALLERAGLNVTGHFEIGEPVDAIKALVDKLAIELVIVGHSRHKPLALRWWRGSVDAMLVERVRCSVLVAADVPHAHS